MVYTQVIGKVEIWFKVLYDLGTIKSDTGIDTHLKITPLHQVPLALISDVICPLQIGNVDVE